MQRKDKLAKLMEKNDVPVEIDYDVLERAKEETDWNLITKDGRVKNLRQNRLIFLIAASMIFVLAVIGISLGLIFHNKSSNSLLPEIKYYHYNTDNTDFYKSIEEYISQNDVQFQYLNVLNEFKEKVTVYLDENKDVLIRQHIFNEETLESVILYVELQENYIFDFLDEYDNFTEKIIINNVEVDYKFRYEESTYSYLTHAQFKYKDKVYRVSFDLIEEDAWINYLQQLIK